MSTTNPAASASSAASGATPPPTAQSIWLPLISTETGRPYGLTEFAYQLFKLMTADPLQRRLSPRLHPILCAVARARCLDMQTRNYFGHTDPDGYGPNYHVKRAGYALPDWYGDDPGSNNIESLALNYATAQAAYTALLESPHHRTHVLGLDDFFAGQTNLGIATAGTVRDNQAVAPFQYCIISAHPL